MSVIQVVGRRFTCNSVGGHVTVPTKTEVDAPFDVGITLLEVLLRYPLRGAAVFAEGLLIIGTWKHQPYQSGTVATRYRTENQAALVRDAVRSTNGHAPWITN